MTKVTKGGAIFHGGKGYFLLGKFLLVWRIGNQKIKINYKETNIKVFTVNPERALKYFEEQEKEKK